MCETGCERKTKQKSILSMIKGPEAQLQSVGFHAYCKHAPFLTCSLSLKCLVAFPVWVRCEWEQGSIFQRKFRYSYVVNEPSMNEHCLQGQASKGLCHSYEICFHVERANRSQDC